MTNAGQRLIEAANEVRDWAEGKTKATLWIDGQQCDMSIDEWFDHRERRAKALSDLAENDADILDINPETSA